MSQKLNEKWFTVQFLLYMAMLASTAIGFYMGSTQPDFPFSLFTASSILVLLLIAYYQNLKEVKP